MSDRDNREDRIRRYQNTKNQGEPPRISGWYLEDDKKEIEVPPPSRKSPDRSRQEKRRQSSNSRTDRRSLQKSQAQRKKQAIHQQKIKKKEERRQRRSQERAAGVIRYYDYNLVACIIFLVAFGLVMLYSASAYNASVAHGSDMHFFRSQTIYCIMGLVAMVIISLFDYHLGFKLGSLIYAGSLFLMALVRFSPLGRSFNNSRRWLRIGTRLTFQPSEIAKIAVIVLLPIIIIKMGDKIKTFKGTAFLVALGAIQAFAAWQLTDNLSTGIIIGGISLGIIFVAHPKPAPYVALGVGAGGAIGAWIWYVKNHMTVETTEGFRLRRILVWLDPERYISEGGYQVMQGLYAIGSGGFLGKGLGNGTQKLSAIPEAQNDMIFSIICEELGLFGAGLITILFVYLLYRLLFIARNAPDLFGSLMVTGIFVHIALQTVLNICVVLNVIPTTGISLPFISSGGTAILFLMAEMGLALSVSRQIKLKV